MPYPRSPLLQSNACSKVSSLMKSFTHPFLGTLAVSPAGATCPREITCEAGKSDLCAPPESLLVRVYELIVRLRRICSLETSRKRLLHVLVKIDEGPAWSGRPCLR